MTNIDILIQVLEDTKSKRKQVLYQTQEQNRADLEQEMMLKMVEVVQQERIQRMNF